MKKHTLMIVEDDPAFRSILERAVKKIPQLELVGSYSDTVAFATNIERKKPDILLLDISITGLDGPEVLEMSAHQPIIIVISIHPESRMSEYKVVYDYYLQKPIKNMEILEQILAACLKS